MAKHYIYGKVGRVSDFMLLFFKKIFLIRFLDNVEFVKFDEKYIDQSFSYLLFRFQSSIKFFKIVSIYTMFE